MNSQSFGVEETILAFKNIQHETGPSRNLLKAYCSMTSVLTQTPAAHKRHAHEHASF